MIKNKVTKLLISAGVVATVIGVSPVILSHAQTFNNEHNYNVDSSNSSIQKAVVNTTVQLSNGTANQYDMAVITGESGNDYTIITQYGVTGSIPKSDLTLVKSGEGNQLVKLNETDHVIHVTTVLNVRQQPDVHSGLLTTLKEDTNIQVTGQEGEWFQVSVNGQTGYVYNDFVGQGTIGNVTPAQAVTNITNQQVQQAGKQAYKRALNNIKTVSNYTNNESNIQNENTPSKTNTTTTTTTRPYQTTITYGSPKPAYVNIANGYLNLRSGAGLENSIIGHLTKNEHVEVLAENGNWYKVNVGNTTGWVYKQYIKLGTLNATPIINPTSTTSSTNPTQVKPISHTTTTTKPEHHEDHNTTNPVV
ncbi:SH3 domain-containing protein, partial [Cetobacterium sp.]|uniref:SH3 domain-containing protein n=1 Tax=Cetobacterium sp. TaxID=2071632 RepID=UPI003F3ED9FB